MCAGSAIWWVLTRLSQVRFINRWAPFVACSLPLNRSVYTDALRGGWCVSSPVWWMLVVLDCAVCLQSNKQWLLLLLFVRRATIGSCLSVTYQAPQKQSVVSNAPITKPPSSPTNSFTLYGRSATVHAFVHKSSAIIWQFIAFSYCASTWI